MLFQQGRINSIKWMKMTQRRIKFYKASEKLPKLPHILWKNHHW